MGNVADQASRHTVPSSVPVLSPGTPVAMLQCSAMDADDLDLQRCDLSTAAVVEVDDCGSASPAFVVQAAIATESDVVVDCRTAASPCNPAVVSLSPTRSVPVTFDR